MNKNNTLILITTKAIDYPDSIFDYNNIVKCDEHVIRIKDELIFAHPLIISENGEKTPEKINEILINFVKNVYEKYLSISEKESVEHILFFIHAKELGVTPTSILEVTNSQSTALKKTIIGLCKKITECHTLAFVHEENHYFGKFIYQSEDIINRKNELNISKWTEFLFKEYEEDTRNNRWLE